MINIPYRTGTETMFTVRDFHTKSTMSLETRMFNRKTNLNNKSDLATGRLEFR